MIRANLWLALLAVILGMVLWLHVQNQAQPSVQREFSVRLIPRETPETLTILRGPSTAAVIAEGSIEDLNKIRAEDVQAYVDFSEAVPGSKTYAVQLVAPTRSPATLTLKNRAVRFELAPILRADRQVELETIGTLPPGLQYDTASIQPDQVQLAGPASEVRSVRKVRAILNLSKILKAGDTYLATVEILGEGNKPLSLVAADPPTVTVYPAVAAAPQSKNLLINPIWSGQPSFGYQVYRYELKPNQLEVTGPSNILATLTKLDTEPISVNELKADSTVVAKVVLPKGIASLQGNRVRVRVLVSLAPQLNPPQSQNP